MKEGRKEGRKEGDKEGRKEGRQEERKAGRREKDRKEAELVQAHGAHSRSVYKSVYIYVYVGIYKHSTYGSILICIVHNYCPRRTLGEQFDEMYPPRNNELHSIPSAILAAAAFVSPLADAC